MNKWQERISILIKEGGYCKCHYEDWSKRNGKGREKCDRGFVASPYHLIYLPSSCSSSVPSFLPLLSFCLARLKTGEQLKQVSGSSCKKKYILLITMNNKKP